MIDYQATALLVASIFAWGVYAGCGAWVGMNYISTDSDPDFADWLAPILFAAPIFASAIIAFAALKYASAEERHARKLADKRRELELLQEQRKIDEQINAELDKMLEVDRE
ncbi:MAG: hypothetical protein U5L04_01820 [Trueperaceae bacterium]|nr:hypothetical protein [Trueperaceae bacterium]